ncbi:uncharacterized protein LOC132504559 isoform X1 [Lagenorhynchus albirostris]|uniref:uncharacterized protein LOC132504559 isoform X1 n=1 Tax=Lagenorhynchus albirostris TaxID=27610 RepID=UPI0028E9B4BE|nr:uncharacterized protein LOC132504559 isoform X1 [Lagenorhynchus albirostris]
MPECHKSLPTPSVYHLCLVPAGQDRHQPRLRPTAPRLCPVAATLHLMEPLGSAGTAALACKVLAETGSAGFLPQTHIPTPHPWEQEDDTGEVAILSHWKRPSESTLGLPPEDHIHSPPSSPWQPPPVPHVVASRVWLEWDHVVCHLRDRPPTSMCRPRVPLRLQATALHRVPACLVSLSPMERHLTGLQFLAITNKSADCDKTGEIRHPCPVPYLRRKHSIQSSPIKVSSGPQIPSWSAIFFQPF